MTCCMSSSSFSRACFITAGSIYVPLREMTVHTKFRSDLILGLARPKSKMQKVCVSAHEGLWGGNSPRAVVLGVSSPKTFTSVSVRDGLWRGNPLPRNHSLGSRGFPRQRPSRVFLLLMVFGEETP
jgi:hypothetical protein